MRDWMSMAFTVRDKTEPSELYFQSIWGFYEFLPRFTAEEGRTGVERLNLVIIDITQHHLSDTFRCVDIWNMYYYESS